MIRVRDADRRLKGWLIGGTPPWPAGYSQLWSARNVDPIQTEKLAFACQGKYLSRRPDNTKAGYQNLVSRVLKSIDDDQEVPDYKGVCDDLATLDPSCESGCFPSSVAMIVLGLVIK